MEILDYRKHAKQLRRPNRLVTSDDLTTPEFQNNLQKMQELLKRDGVGLAAPQIDWHVKLFLLCIDESGKEGPIQFFLNPQLLKKSKETEKLQEGCLSLPGLYLSIARPTYIEWEYYDMFMQKRHCVSTGFYARAVMHEIDHLNGQLMLDLCGNIQQLKVKRWLNEQM